ncbi:MAG: amiloride-sensitive sodium channel family protein, partial [Phycisphaerales bacterium]|nr:amiloride-sensitive sodium channel family protein [Phycisphaerales bacterium]
MNKINEIFLEDQSVMSFVGKPTGNDFVDAYVNFVAKFSPMWYKNDTGDDKDLAEALSEAISRVSLYNDISRDVISGAGIQLEQYVARCFMGGVQCNLTRDFHQFFDQYYFNCYTYDPLASASGRSFDDNLPWLSPGLDNGLTIVVLTGSGMLKWNPNANVIPGLYDMGSATAGADGVRVMIHAPDVVPFPLAEGFDVPPGFSVSFGIRPRRNVRIGPPHGD